MNRKTNEKYVIKVIPIEQNITIFVSLNCMDEMVVG